MMDYTEVSKT